MTCQRFEPMIVGRLYGEIAGDEEHELAAHLEACADCRAALEALSEVRGALRAGEPDLPATPRVVVLREPARLRPALLAASILGAAILAGAAAGGGYAIGRLGAGPGPIAAAAGRPEPAALDAATREAIDDAVAARLAAVAPQRPGAASGGPVTAGEMEAALSRLQRDVRRERTADMDYFLTQLAASEVRTGQRIGQTNQALRYVALASNPNVSEQ